MRRDDLYLNDIIEAADHIAAFLGQTDFWDRLGEVWKAAQIDCPALRREVTGILSTEFGAVAGDSDN
jgi:hypothetical protein